MQELEEWKKEADEGGASYCHLNTKCQRTDCQMSSRASCLGLPSCLVGPIRLPA